MEIRTAWKFSIGKTRNNLISGVSFKAFGYYCDNLVGRTWSNWGEVGSVIKSSIASVVQIHLTELVIGTICPPTIGIY